MIPRETMVPAPESEPKVPLLKTKTSIPQLPPVFVHRSRLIKQIDLGIRGPVTVLTAPAGFGKTNLLLEWVAHNLRSQKPRSIAWLTLDEEDDAPPRFWHYLIAAVQVLDPQLGKDASDFFQGSSGNGPQAGLTLFLNEISSYPNDIILVLDDLHVVENASIYRNLRFLLKHLPRNLHVVIASRREPNLDLASLRAKGWVTDIGIDELRFSEEEISLFFFQIMGLHLTQTDVQALEERTEGWITPLKLAAISLGNRPDPTMLLTGFHGDARYLVDFLSEEVLSRQPEDVRRFLLRSSILDIFSGSLCESVVEPDAQPGFGSMMLSRLEHSHLFLTPLDAQHEWFRYHPLFEDFLRHEQHRTLDDETASLHKRAAAWFEGHGDLNEAFKHALASMDDQYAGDLIERNVEPLIKAGELPVLTRWIGKLDRNEIHKRPFVSLAYAWSSIAAFQLDNARVWLDDLQRSVEEQTAGQTPSQSASTDSLWNIAGGLAVCRSTLALLSGDAQTAAKYSKEAAEHLVGENPFMQSMISLEGSINGIYSGDTAKAIEMLNETIRLSRLANNFQALIHSLCRLAEMQSLQGHLSHALVTLQKARLAAIGPDGTPLPLMGLVDIHLGRILFERDLLDEARECLERGIRLTQSWLSRDEFDGMISLARLFVSRGDYTRAQALIEAASEMSLKTGSGSNEEVAAVACLRLALQKNDLGAAAKELEKINQLRRTIPPSIEKGAYPVHEYLQLTLARYHLTFGKATGDASHLHQAVQILDSLLPKAEKFQRVTSAIEILVLQAMAQLALGETDQAVPILMHALALGELEDYRRIFLDEGESMAKLLMRCRQARQSSSAELPSSGYIDSLLESLQPGTGAAWLLPQAVPQRVSAVPENGLPFTLSGRELQVLSLIAEGKSNQEISAELFLALNTVKRHAYNIYAKLEVKKRTQAVAKARQLGLIP